MHVHIRSPQGSRGRPLGSRGQTTGLVKEQKGKRPSPPRPRCPSRLSKLHSMSSTLAVPICRASISALLNVPVSSIVVLAGGKSNIFTHNIHIWYVLFDFKCPFIIFSPLVRTAWRLPGSSAEEGLKRPMAAASSCAFSGFQKCGSSG